MAAKGYPAAVQKGDAITGIEQAEALGSVRVYHAGTALQGDRMVTSGGRVLGVTATGSTLQEARDLAYRAVECIQFTGAQYRHDIAHRALRT